MCAFSGALPDACRLPKIPRVNIYLKVAAALASVAILWLGFMYVLYVRSEPTRCHTITLTGSITPNTFDEARRCLVRSTAPKKTFVVAASPGGNTEVALALGMLIHRHNWDVEIVDYCISSCANFIFPAGKVKYLNRNSVVVFHGGPHQHNLFEMAMEVDRSLAMRGGRLEHVDYGQVGRENTVGYDPRVVEASQEVREFLSIESVSSAVDLLNELRSLSDQFYHDLGVDRRLPDYGQIGDYESTYKSYKHIGFMYRLEDLSELGVSNIKLKDGEWLPEQNPLYQDVYEVSYP